MLMKWSENLWGTVDKTKLAGADNRPDERVFFSEINHEMNSKWEYLIDW